jgi:hypothetical protein
MEELVNEFANSHSIQTGWVAEVPRGRVARSSINDPISATSNPLAGKRTSMKRWDNRPPSGGAIVVMASPAVTARLRRMHQRLSSLLNSRSHTGFKGTDHNPRL